MAELLGHGPSNSERVSSLPVLSSNSVVASHGPLLAQQESDKEIYGQQQMWHNQQNGQISMTVSEPATMQLPKKSAMQPSLPNRPLYVPGNCARRFIQYMHQLHRNANASIEFWRKVVAEFFAPTAKKRWCFSLCKNRPKQGATFAQREWHCQVCEQKPGCGYEVTAEMLPTLARVGHETGILQELLYVDMPSEHPRLSGEIAVHYNKATVELVYENLRIAHDGHLCVVFTPDQKITSWDFCIRNVEQYISGRSLLPQLHKLEFLSWNYNRAVRSTSSILQSSELKRHSEKLVEAASGLQKALNMPQVTDVGYTRRYLRCIEISEVVNCMGDVLDLSVATGLSPRMSLAVLGGLSSEDRAVDSNSSRKRPLLQITDRNKKAPNGGQSNA
ncbi:hypothetical protein DCAR_0101271 [Daucus carota subsp. sativus]|uniref:Uncharacterized protein n=2 Tax=Daucus carota subsp. sativus TaxID=79200 RepID=A0A166G8Y6_DAUCS|nr:hypothetical protein DCAR_0101271 [Daucus carota subsp. sativus]